VCLAYHRGNPLTNTVLFREAEANHQTFD
jgi:hypothetical protein